MYIYILPLGYKNIFNINFIHSIYIISRSIPHYIIIYNY
jgi:hypothetical protein